MSDTRETGAGPVENLRRVARNGLGLAQNRLELFQIEVQEEKVRLLQIILLICGLASLAALALATATFTIIVMFWDNGRLPALIALSVFYVAGAGTLTLALRNKLRNSPEPFSSTIQEFAKDSECLY
jgi:uncharacterized membrane protein YqjE